MNDPVAKLPTRVIKLGGSLLGNSDTPKRIELWLVKQAECQKPGDSKLWRNFWIVGGGELADTVRDWDAKFSLEPSFTHWICIDLMDINARLLSAWFTRWPIIDQFSSDHESGNQIANQIPNQIVLVSPWLRQGNTDLPQSWATTSDSIAMAAADLLQADELVLLKSCDPPGFLEPIDPSGPSGLSLEWLSLESLASSDFVDKQFVPQFRSLTKKMSVRFVNFNSDLFSEAVLKQ